MPFSGDKTRDSPRSPLRSRKELALGTWAGKESPIRHLQLMEQNTSNLLYSVPICGHPDIGNERTAVDDNGAAVNRLTPNHLDLGKVRQLVSEADYRLASAAKYHVPVMAIN